MLTKRGKVVLVLALIVALYILITFSTKLWWTGGGYCFDSYATCYGGEVRK